MVLGSGTDHTQGRKEVPPRISDDPRKGQILSFTRKMKSYDTKTAGRLERPSTFVGESLVPGREQDREGKRA